MPRDLSARARQSDLGFLLLFQRLFWAGDRCGAAAKKGNSGGWQARHIGVGKVALIPFTCIMLAFIVTIDNKIFHSKRLEFGLCRGTAARGSFVAKYPGIQHTMRTAGRPKCHKIGRINSVAAAFSVIFRCAEAKTEQVDFGRQCRWILAQFLDKFTHFSALWAV